ncbi:hypothetical protein SARC_05240 [Sphaeroforma arctica JP610]|uniref:Uncharacterized protein n=1 Tax=Sphaeroforma arctica JP610 TaxID=667725 RepID=A0A0L0G073_9EUKA|nr:hypothetical protein SARC_05240 [Sphaeroforma arctica JP610]KNC82470.1 hypothetical protein SARC_05240 [Sphaeroforma arctica JP610]|eukprot:XP_014156372.1 hypothetical protein SARC_05240 [Sphaeroforma arctica JP610]
MINEANFRNGIGTFIKPTKLATITAAAFRAHARRLTKENHVDMCTNISAQGNSMVTVVTQSVTEITFMVHSVFDGEPLGESPNLHECTSDDCDATGVSISSQCIIQGCTRVQCTVADLRRYHFNVMYCISVYSFTNLIRDYLVMIDADNVDEPKLEARLDSLNTELRLKEFQLERMRSHLSFLTDEHTNALRTNANEIEQSEEKKAMLEYELMLRNDELQRVKQEHDTFIRLAHLVGLSEDQLGNVNSP